MRRPAKIEEAEVARRLEGLPGWALREGALHREIGFRDFSEAFAFMTRVALLAERLDHHPDWSNVYSRVTIRLWTHDAGGITERDLGFAEAVSRLLEQS